MPLSASTLLLTTLSATRTLLGIEALIFPTTALAILIPSTHSSPSPPSLLTSLPLMTRLFAARELVIGCITLQTLYQCTRPTITKVNSDSSVSEAQDVKASKRSKGSEWRREQVMQRLKFLLLAGIAIDVLDVASCMTEYIQGRLEYEAMIKLGIAAVGAICAAEVGLVGLN